MTQDGPPANAILEECEPGDECTGAASCSGTCGLHELGDRACMCTADELTCTACTLSAEFTGQLQNATAFCLAGVDDGDMCALKGETCIDINYNNAGVGRRDFCLCWMGRTRLEWDCSQNGNGFFQDMAPETPPRPDAAPREAGSGQGPRDGGSSPPDAPSAD